MDAFNELSLLFIICHVNSLCKLIICHDFFSSQYLKMTFQYLSTKKQVYRRCIHLLIGIVLHLSFFFLHAVREVCVLQK